MPRIYKSEKWKEISIKGKLQFRYAVSNLGQLMSFNKRIKDGRIITPGDTKGYKVFHYRTWVKGKINYHHYFIRELVATAFLRKKSSGQNYVIQLDHDKSNNRLSNLQWANRKEMIENYKKSPLVISARKKLNEYKKTQAGPKLTIAKVRELKKKLLNPKRRTLHKDLAKQYGVSEMALYRIKRGENWGHIKV